MLRAGRQLSFSLGELFPGLSYPVLISLDRSHLTKLYRAWTTHGWHRFGHDTTKDFVLLHVFGISAALVREPVDLLRVLLRRHYQGQRLPKILDDRFIHHLRGSRAFDSWELAPIVRDRDTFFSFLQERWPLFLDRFVDKKRRYVGETRESFNLKVKGPTEIPFEHDDIRVYVDNLFIEGMLSPVPHYRADDFRDNWAAVGIQIDLETDISRRLAKLMDGAAATVPQRSARHDEWMAFAYRWAELCVLWLKAAAPSRSEQFTQFAALKSEVDESFRNWTEPRYAGLHNQPPNPPVMVHHIPRCLARRLEDDPNAKVALIVVDGLSLDQWIVLREVMAAQRARFRFRECAVFAWLPTITSVSRQAIFAGKPPFYFPSSIHTTDKEASAWTQFWVDQGVAATAVGFTKGLGRGLLGGGADMFRNQDVRVIGLVVDTVDKIMHGMEMGTAGMHNQVRQWANEGFMAGLLEELLDQRFCVFLTSDHGNIEADGLGRPAEGVVADVRGERVRIYPDKLLRSNAKKKYPDAISWPAIGLPDDYLPLLAPGRSAFVREGSVLSVTADCRSKR